MRPRRLRRDLALVVLVMALAGCGGSPLNSLGLRSSDWINEPTVPTTIAVVTTTPTVVAAERLLWANDDLGTENLEDVQAVLEQVFARRQGDRFIQASRFEIAAAMDGVAFPDLAPAGAEWVSSQLVFDNDGTVADEPSAAFGIWSAEPYSRSRSVAQMVVLKISTDQETASQLASGELAPSCALFSDRTTDQCELVTVGSRATWILTSSGGSTVVWFDGPYRYELFGRSFVPIGILRQMSDDMVPLASIEAQSS